MSKVNVTRPINGIALNGDEFLLNDQNEPMVFDDVEAAQQFLIDNGLDEEDLDLFNYPQEQKQ